MAGMLLRGFGGGGMRFMFEVGSGGESGNWIRDA